MRLLLPLLVLLPACGPTIRLQMREQRDARTLSSAANDYWIAVRWNDPAAGAWLDSPDERLRLGRMMSDAEVRLTDVQLVQVVLGDELPAERLPDTREGVAVVKVEGFDTRSNRVDTVTLEQHWVRTAHGWHIDGERSPLGADRPW